MPHHISDDAKPCHSKANCT